MGHTVLGGFHLDGITMFVGCRCGQSQTGVRASRTRRTGHRHAAGFAAVSWWIRESLGSASTPWTFTSSMNALDQGITKAPRRMAGASNFLQCASIAPWVGHSKIFSRPPAPARPPDAPPRAHQAGSRKQACQHQPTGEYVHATPAHRDAAPTWLSHVSCRTQEAADRHHYSAPPPR